MIRPYSAVFGHTGRLEELVMGRARLGALAQVRLRVAPQPVGIGAETVAVEIYGTLQLTEVIDK